MALTPEEHAAHVDTILRGSNLTPDAQVSLRVVLADQKLCTEALLAMFQHLTTPGSGDWSAQWDFIRDKLQAVGYPRA
jgi:hypothetical protein